MAIKTQWKLKDIQWREVFKRQDYATLLLTACFIVGLVIPYAISDPRTSAYIIYDATISNAGYDNFKPSVPNFVPVLVPLLTFAITVVVGELISSKSQHNTVTEAVASALFFVLDGIQSFVCGLLVVQITKLVVGRTRPDFLARCNPIIPGNITITIGGDPNALWPCQRPYDDVLKDGFQSFPSGHTSTAFNLTVYTSAYLIWCWHMRLSWTPVHLSMKQQFLLDLRNVAAKLWMLVLLGVAWGIAISRIIDNQHHPSDVIGGALIGICIALIYVLRAIPRYKRVLSPEVKSAQGDLDEMSV
ncbi:hypothetical protein ACKKBF_B37335 [Auxenochlorella protothecoides x Auxenochlorella symbiontica]|uniref:Phosphatidic acid phosphatase type 2/haloperoxidase domain-containing protein n=1 Tax=Auxenochlorella protothecoides TaxID=3075 RepID=A0A1D2A8W2_AUXPR